MIYTNDIYIQDHLHKPYETSESIGHERVTRACNNFYHIRISLFFRYYKRITVSTSLFFFYNMKFLRKDSNEESTRLLTDQSLVKDEGEHDKYEMVYWVRIGPKRYDMD